MSILDELRKKADEKKAAELQEAVTAEHLEQIYQTKLLPKMQLLFDSINEAINYLNILDEPVVVKDYCAKYPQFGDLVQGSYRINTDGRMGLADYNRLMEINLNFYCEGKGDFNYILESGALIRKEIDFLQSKKLNFDWKYLDPVNGVPSVSITIQRKIPVTFRIEVDYQHSALNVIIKNHQNLESFTKKFVPEQLDDNFIDSLLSYFLRKSNRFVKGEEITEDVTSEIKATIKTNLATIQQKLELSSPEEPKTPEAVTEKKVGAIKSILSVFQKKN